MGQVLHGSARTCGTERLLSEAPVSDGEGLCFPPVSALENQSLVLGFRPSPRQMVTKWEDCNDA